MIAKIEGVLESIEEGKAYVRLQDPSGQGLTYEVLLPAFAAARLGGSLGQRVSLVTMYYLESQGQGSNMVPRLAGFLTKEDRQFFELFTTCKGIGPRKALRAMALDVGRLAGAIADRDAATLQTLPEIGRRTAETIVATLHGKVDRFVSAGGEGRSAGGDASGPGGGGAEVHVVGQALNVLLQLGENRVQASEWIAQAMREEDDDPVRDVQHLITKVYRVKAKQ